MYQEWRVQGNSQEERHGQPRLTLDQKIDFKVVGEALDLKAGTASMRWRRLKDRIEKTPSTAGAAAKSDVDRHTVFLYNCVMACEFTVSTSQQRQILIYKLTVTKFDWNAVGKNLGLKSGTASMRWRRLKDKIQVSELPEVGVLAMASTPTSTRPVAPTPSFATPAADDVARKPTPKRKRDIKSKDDSSEISIDERLAKRIKEEEGATKRQTRGKILNLKDPIDSSSSVTGSSVITTESSFYEPSVTKEEEEEDYMSGAEPRKKIKSKTGTLPQVFKVEKNAQSRVAEQKAASKQQPLTPAAVRKPVKESIYEPKAASKKTDTKLDFNPWEDAASRDPPLPKLISPLSAKTIRSFNEDHEQVKADIAGFRAQTTAYKNPYAAIHAASDDEESAAAESSAVCTSVVGTHDTYKSEEYEASVSPADSISVIAKAQGPAGGVDIIEGKDKEKNKSEDQLS